MSDLYGVNATADAPDVKPRCWKCNRVIAWLVSRPWALDCPRCRARNVRGLPEDASLAALGVSTGQGRTRVPVNHRPVR